MSQSPQPELARRPDRRSGSGLLPAAQHGQRRRSLTLPAASPPPSRPRGSTGPSRSARPIAPWLLEHVRKGMGSMQLADSIRDLRLILDDTGAMNRDQAIEAILDQMSADGFLPSRTGVGAPARG